MAFSVTIVYVLATALLVASSVLWMSGHIWLGPCLGSAALALACYTGQRSRHLLERVLVAVCVLVLSGGWLFELTTQYTDGGRGKYQSGIPFLIGLTVAVPCWAWPAKKAAAGWKRLVVRAGTCTLLLAPVPWGLEGTLAPAILALLFPPLILLALFPGQVVLTFLAFLNLFSLSGEVYAAVQTRRSQTAQASK